MPNAVAERAPDRTPESGPARARWRRFARGFALAGLCLATPSVRADKHVRQPQPEDVLPQSDFDDPIGVDRESRAVERTAVEAQQKAAARELPAEKERFGPEPPPLDVRQGEVLTGAPSTRERAHRVEVELEPGMATVRVEMEFETPAQKPSELRYRLAVPAGSRLASLEVCSASANANGHGGCRSGLLERTRGPSAYDAAVLARGAAHALPIAHAALTHDARGDAIVVRAAPVSQAEGLKLKLSYASPTALHGGVLRLTLPARGMDPQAAPAEVKLLAPALIDARVGDVPVASGAVTSFDPWLEVPLRARAKDGEPVHANAWDAACGKQRCALAELWAGPRPGKPAEIVIALDVSPSTEGPARSRELAAVTALLNSAPEGSRVRALAFASRARPLVEQAMEPSQVALAGFDRALHGGELGSATRFEAAWELARGWLKTHKPGLKPLIVIVGDGGLTLGESKPFARARAAGVEVSALNAADRPTTRGLFSRVLEAGGVALDIASEADAASRGRDAALLEERLRALFAPTVAAKVSVAAAGRKNELGPLRAGEQLGWQGVAPGAIALQYGASAASHTAPAGKRAAADALVSAAAGEALGPLALAAVDAHDLGPKAAADWPEIQKHHCDRRGPARRESGISADAKPIALAEERACKPVPKPKVRADGELEVGTGMPGDPLLSMLRQRILPVARGCFRRDRAGRSDYHTRAVFVFTLAEREVVDAHVEGKITDELRGCLLAAIDTLDVPRFTGIVNVHYPLVTEAVPLPEQIDLKAGTAGTIDRLFGLPGTK